jgi:hypothetical protein
LIVANFRPLPAVVIINSGRTSGILPSDPEGRHEDTLYLSVTVQRSSRPEQVVEKCDECCVRDRKAVKGKGELETLAKDGSYVPEVVSLSTQEEDNHIASLAESSRMITFKGLKRRRFNGGTLFLSVYVRCYSIHHNELNGYRHVD